MKRNLRHICIGTGRQVSGHGIRAFLSNCVNKHSTYRTGNCVVQIYGAIYNRLYLPDVPVCIDISIDLIQHSILSVDGTSSSNKNFDDFRKQCFITYFD